jgi:hypothetical protein
VAPQDLVLFSPGAVYPHLHVIDLTYARHCESDTYPINEQQLQQLCSCCPAVETLQFGLSADASPTALLPLLQLSALTHLGVDALCLFTTVEAMAGVAAQLTGLKQLALTGLPYLADPFML